MKKRLISTLLALMLLLTLMVPAMAAETQELSDPSAYFVAYANQTTDILVNGVAVPHAPFLMMNLTTGRTSEMNFSFSTPHATGLNRLRVSFDVTDYTDAYVLCDITKVMIGPASASGSSYYSAPFAGTLRFERTGTDKIYINAELTVENSKSYIDADILEISIRDYAACSSGFYNWNDDEPFIADGRRYIIGDAAGNTNGVTYENGDEITDYPVELIFDGARYTMRHFVSADNVVELEGQIGWIDLDEDGNRIYSGFQPMYSDRGSRITFQFDDADNVYVQYSIDPDITPYNFARYWGKLQFTRKIPAEWDGYFVSYLNNTTDIFINGAPIIDHQVNGYFSKYTSRITVSSGDRTGLHYAYMNYSIVEYDDDYLIGEIISVNPSIDGVYGDTIPAEGTVRFDRAGPDADRAYVTIDATLENTVVANGVETYTIEVSDYPVYMGSVWPRPWNEDEPFIGDGDYVITSAAEDSYGVRYAADEDVNNYPITLTFDGTDYTMTHYVSADTVLVMEGFIQHINTDENGRTVYWGYGDNFGDTPNYMKFMFDDADNIYVWYEVDRIYYHREEAVYWSDGIWFGRETPVDPGEPKEFTELIMGSGMSNTGEYMVTVNGTVSGTFSEGENRMAYEDISGQSLGIMTYNLTNGAYRVMDQGTVEGMIVTVTNGVITNVAVTGRAQTSPGNFDRYTVNCTVL